MSVINDVDALDAACSVDQISACKTAGKCKVNLVFLPRDAL